MKSILAVLALILLVGVFPQVGAAATYTSSASAQPGSATPGQTITLTASVRSDTAMNSLVDLELYGPGGTLVFQKYWDNTALAAGQTHSLSTSWTVPATAAQGVYTLKVGLFTAGWVSLVHWNNSAGQLTVSTAAPTPSPTSAPAGGSGLTGIYFDNANLTGQKLTRVDPTVNFNWGTSRPSGAIAPDTFSARWQGQVQAPSSETFTFYTVSDDGVRLWVNGQKLIDNWTNHSPTENQGQIALVAGQRYTILLEYYESAGGAQIALAWSSPSRARQVVPQANLYPSGGSTPPAPTPTQPAPTATAVPPTATVPPPTATAVPPTPTPAPGQRFSTLPPGSALPSEAQCAAAVKRRPENKGANVAANATPGNQTLPADFLGGWPGDAPLIARVTGNFTGTTDEILQWVACKWGVDEDMVRAQAAKESWWLQSTKGDWTSDATRCPPNHGLGVDGRAGQCPESYGILQNRYPYEQAAWPGLENSTAFNADVAYMIWRSCYEGNQVWLNHVERGREYGAGDAWGCMGRWFAGRWYTQPAIDYIGAVQGYLNERIWEQPHFQQP